jgi:hypothetical protein
MDAWQDPQGRCFNPDATITQVALPNGACCLVVDDVLCHPHGLVDWAVNQHFAPPAGFPYPGLVLSAPARLQQRMADFFSARLRGPLGARRLLDLTLRLSMVTTAPQDLAPLQWQCHRDRVAADPQRVLFAASVLYLFESPSLGGTSFYVPRQSETQTQQLIQDSQQLDAARFSQRYGLQAGYMAGSNAYFERVARVGAAWNRMVVYDGSVFHSGDIAAPDQLSLDPRQGRLSLNGFFTCKRNAA